MKLVHEAQNRRWLRRAGYPPAVQLKQCQITYDDGQQERQLQLRHELWRFKGDLARITPVERTPPKKRFRAAA